MSGTRAPGLLTRIGQAGKFLLTGQAPDEWFPPLPPLAPLAPPGVAGRQFDYPSGYNLNTTPRADEAIGFPQLRALADSYDILRLVIETRKDQLAALRWTIQPRDKTKRKLSDPRIAAISDFLACPDREHSWDQWLRMLVEDLLVIDAPTLYKRRSRNGALYALEPIDGATIKRVIDDWGRTPMPPDPAFQQVLKGMPAVNYTTDELFYLPRNVRTQKVYGFSPVEQCVLTINTGLRRALHKLEFYTAGSVPDALAAVPETWTAQQIGEFQEYWDALLSGDTAQRRRIRFVPGGIAKGFIQTKEQVLKDDFDEWLARVVCYAFSVSSQWATRQVNRATAETAQEQALQEGLEPLKAWTKTAIDMIVARCWNAPDLELGWQEEQDTDPAAQANIANLYLRAGVVTINEVRADLGRDPIEGGDEPMLYTGTGVVPLSAALAGDDLPPTTGDDPAASAEATAALEAESAPGRRQGDAQHGDAMAKRAPSKSTTQEGNLAGIWRHFFASSAPAIARRVAAAAARGGRMAKTAGDTPDDAIPADDADPDEEPKPAQDTSSTSDAPHAEAAEAAAEAVAGEAAPAGNPALATPSPDSAVAAAEGAITDGAAAETVDAAIEGAVLDAPWSTVQQATSVALQAAARSGVAAGVSALDAIVGPQAAAAAAPGRGIVAGIGAQDITKLANPRAVAWAEQHAAELLRGVQQTTIDGVRAMVVQAEREGWSVARLQGEIERGWQFSADRALTIARTELKRADTQANIMSWQAMQQRTGVQVKKRVLLGMNENHCIACSSAAAEGAIPVDESFAVGFAPPFHPNCYCGLISVVAAPMAKGAADQPRDDHGRWTSAAGAYDAAAEIARGRTAMGSVIAHRIDVEDAMNAPGIGPVGFLWGKPGNGAAFKGGYGVSHIVAKRNAEGLDGLAVAHKVPEIIARGKQGAPYGPTGAQRVNIEHNGHTVVLSQSAESRGAWLLTAWK